MSLEESVIARLRCPKSGEKLVPAPEILLSRLGEQEGFASENGEWFYRIEEGFPVLTAEAAIEISKMELDWDEHYREDTPPPWDKGAPAPPLTDYISGDGEITGKVFVPGCGRGFDALYIADQEGAEVTGFDISPTAVKAAKDLAKEKKTSGINFVVGDLFDLSKEMLGAFDWVVEHTCLSGMPPSFRPAYFDAIYSVLPPGGRVFAIWFVDPEMEPGESGPPFGISKKEVADLAGDRFELVREWIPQETFEGREGRELVQILRRK